MLALLLGACGGGGIGAGLGQPACKESTDYEWDWSPIRFVVAAEDDGSFRVDTGWEQFPVISGSWGEESLAYEENAEPAEDSWIKSSRAVGTLEVMDGGNYRTEYEQTVVDVNDEPYSFTVQTARTGCVQTDRLQYDFGTQVDQTATYDAEGADVEGTEVSKDGFSLTEERYDKDGAYTEDATITWPEAGEDQVLHVEGDWTVGYFVDEYTGSTPDFTYEGVDENSPDGSEHTVYTGTRNDGYWWKYDHGFDYDGNGSGTYENSEGVECDLTYVEWERICDCNDGNDGPCG